MSDDANPQADHGREIDRLIATANAEGESSREADTKANIARAGRVRLYDALDAVARFVAGTNPEWVKDWCALFLSAGVELKRFGLAVQLETLRYDGPNTGVKIGTESAFRMYQLACAGDKDGVETALRNLSECRSFHSGSFRDFLRDVRDKAYPWTATDDAQSPDQTEPKAAPTQDVVNPQGVGVETSLPASPQSAAAPAYTLGDLIRELEGSDQASAEAKAVAERKAAAGRLDARRWYVQAAVFRWQADPQRMPGIERIELICNRLFGSGITAESIRRLRAKLCDDYHLQLPRVADQLDLKTVANIIENLQEVSFDGMQAALQDDFHHGLATQDCIRIGDGSVQVTGLSCKVIAGTTPNARPDANPAVPPSVLPMIDNAIRRLNKLPPGTTIHWVGHDTGYRSRCQCPQFRDAPFAAPFDKNRWAAQVEGGGPNVTGPPTPSDLPLSDLQYDILAALLRLKATSPDQGQKSETLALKLPNKPSPTVLKEAARPMVSRYIDSKSGPGGGYWLTDAGRQLTERVQNR